MLEVVLFCYCLEDSTDLNGLAVGAGPPFDCGADAMTMSLRFATSSGSLSSSKVNLVGVRVTTASVGASTPCGNLLSSAMI